MLRSTFLHIPGVGEKTERGIHKSGVLTWEDFLADAGRVPVGEKLRAECVRMLELSVDALSVKDVSFFKECVPAREMWRLYREFSGSVAFLDIETNGFSAEKGGMVTVVGIYDGADMKSYVRGENLFLLPEEFEKYDVLVTFNGSVFDLPFLRTQFGKRYREIFTNCAHIDLRFLFRRLGMTGGLKVIEKKLGVMRPDYLAPLDGYDAVMLWNRYRNGEEWALDKLIEYNREDVVNLKFLAEYAYSRLSARLLSIDE